MVTVFGPVKRVVSIWATTAVDWPGATTPCIAVALVQPQETRTLVIRTAWPVLLVRRYEWVNIGPRGTLPKSRASSSNIPSAQVAAWAGADMRSAAVATRLSRNIRCLSLCRLLSVAAGSRPGGRSEMGAVCNYSTRLKPGQTLPVAPATAVGQLELPIPYGFAHR